MRVLDVIADQAWHTVRDCFEELHNSLTSCQSPIEKDLIVALVAFAELLAISKSCKNRPTFSKEIPSDLDEGFFYITPQAKVGKYRVDFMVSILKDGERKCLCVECDGHDFHERTKAQAAYDRERDRFMMDAGMPLYRFTGSEIFKDPFRCASQIFCWCEDRDFQWIDAEAKKHAAVA